MEFTWTALCFLVLFVTPALPFLFWLRVVLPRSVPVLLDEKTTWVTLSVSGALLNLNLIGYVAKATYEEISRNVHLVGVKYELAAILLQQDFHPWRPAIRVYELFSSETLSRTSLWALIFDLHLRPFVVGALVAGCIWLISEFSDWRELSAWEKLLDKGGSKHVLEIQSKRQWLSLTLHRLRRLFLSPWAQLTYSNDKRELLMLDVLTKGDPGMYSGFFSACVIDGKELKAVALEYAISYSKDKPVTCKSKPGEQLRKVKFVRNNGELVIPAEEIANLHFWELRKRYKLEIQVTDPTWLDILNQYALLSVLFPGFIRGIDVYIELEATERRKFLEKFAEFAQAHDIRLGSTGIIKMMVKRP